MRRGEVAKEGRVDAAKALEMGEVAKEGRIVFLNSEAGYVGTDCLKSPRRVCHSIALISCRWHGIRALAFRKSELNVIASHQTVPSCNRNCSLKYIFIRPPDRTVSHTFRFGRSYQRTFRPVPIIVDDTTTVIIFCNSLRSRRFYTIQDLFSGTTPSSLQVSTRKPTWMLPAT